MWALLETAAVARTCQGGSGAPHVVSLPARHVARAGFLWSPERLSCG
jgi:hypothetical protein